MKNKTNLNRESRFAVSLKQTLKGLVVGALILTGIDSPLQAQEVVEYSRPSWYFGVAGGANFNFFDGSTQKLNDAFTPPTTFHKGTGIGLFLAPSIEFHKPD
ncbi:MAG TPA: hypothetical protein VLM44_13410, partial [Lutibacter sp.]|nr:hypothetical protein [Lutibacter sp.]